jgi:hypothetical protein
MLVQPKTVVTLVQKTCKKYLHISFLLVSLNPGQLKQFRESLERFYLKDWDDFQTFRAESLKVKPEDENTVFPEVEAWNGSEELSGFINSLIFKYKSPALTKVRRTLRLVALQ